MDKYKLTLQEVISCEKKVELGAMLAHDPLVSKGFEASRKLLNHYKYLILSGESCPEEELVLDDGE